MYDFIKVGNQRHASTYLKVLWENDQNWKNSILKRK